MNKSHVNFLCFLNIFNVLDTFKKYIENIYKSHAIEI